MKNLFTAMVMLMAFASHAQSFTFKSEDATAVSKSSIVESSMDAPPKYEYAELVGTQKLLSTKVMVQVDFGQERSFWKGTEYMRDEATGKLANFNSMVDAMNYMATQGWTFEQAYVVSIGNQNVYHWLMRRLVTEEDL